MSPTRFVAPPALMVAALAVGCAVGPHYRTPHAPVDAGYAPTALPEASASAEVHGGETQHFVAGRDIAFEWWELFQSAALDELIKKAFKANPRVAAATISVARCQPSTHLSVLP